MKLYIDSRFRVEGTHTDFSIELPRPVVVPRGKAVVDCVCVPNTFYTIRTGENDKIHIREADSGIVTYRIISIAPGQYNAFTLKDALLLALQTGSTMNGNYTVTYDVATNRLGIGTTGTATFALFPAALLKADPNAWNVGAFAESDPLIDAKNLQDCGAVTGFGTGTVIQAGSYATTVVADSAVNTLPYQQLFLRSNLGQGDDCLGPSGGSDIIRRIICQVPLNDTIVDLHSLPYDSVSVGSREFNSMSFKLTDALGNSVDTKGHHISFSIIFLASEE